MGKYLFKDCVTDILKQKIFYPAKNAGINRLSNLTIRALKRLILSYIFIVMLNENI